jgi:Anti-sigma-K factor rskA
MSTMDHAEAHERIADLALEPSRLAELKASVSVQDRALREHIADCPRCQAQVADWQLLQSTVATVLRGTSRDTAEAIVPPPALRRRVLAAAHAEPREPAVARTEIGVARSRLRRSGAIMLALAAALAIVAAGLGVWVVNDQSRINAAADDQRALAGLAAAMNQVMTAPDSHMVSLKTADGAVGGSIAWSRHDLVVTASNLSAPAAGQIYRCWLVYEGKQSPIGEMRFAGKTAFWIGWTQDWASVDLEPDAQFLVTLEANQSPGSAPSGPVLLQATLGG